MGISGAKRAKIYDDQTDVYVDIGLISQKSTYSKDGLHEQDIDGMPVWVEDIAKLKLVFFDDVQADIAQLITWQKNHTKLTIIVTGHEDSIFWTDPTTIVLSEPSEFKAGKKNVRTITTQAKGDLSINREPGYGVVDSNGEQVEGFIARDVDAEGAAVVNMPPATYGADEVFTWTIDGTDYNMDIGIMQEN